MKSDSQRFLNLIEIRRQAEENLGKPEPFLDISHEGLREIARRSPPTESQLRPWVSEFGDWVYECYRYPNGRATNPIWEQELARRYNLRAELRLGKAAEPEMVERCIAEIRREDEEKRKQGQQVRQEMMISSAKRRCRETGWEIKYDGTLGSSDDAQVLSRLKVRNESLKARPDLVLRDRKSGDLLVLEFKTWLVRKKGLPMFGWPNVKVQLWCYGLIEWPEQPSQIYLQAQVWERYEEGLTGRFWTLAPRRADDPLMTKESLDLFEAFGGTYCE